MNDIQMKAQIMEGLFLNEKSIDYAGRLLGIYAGLGHALSIEDWEVLKESRVFFHVVFSPGVSSPVEKSIPAGAQVISLEFNALSIMSEEQRVAIALHEIGHALNPKLIGEAGEFVADDYAINRGYGQALKKSLEFCISKWPDEFDKPITRKRIGRINSN